MAIGNGGSSIWEGQTVISTLHDGEKPEDGDEWDYGEIVDEEHLAADGPKVKERPLPPAINWLKDQRMLPCIVPNSRIMEFHYSKQDSQISQLWSLTKRFLQCLVEKRGVIPFKSTPVRPVIFVAYGHGCLILELAVIMSYTYRKPPSGLPLPQATQSIKDDTLPATISSSAKQPLPPQISVLSPSAAGNEESKSAFSIEASKSQASNFAFSLGPDATDTKASRYSGQQSVDERERQLSGTSIPIKRPDSKGSAFNRGAEDGSSKPTLLSVSPLNLEALAGIILLGVPLEAPEVTEHGTDQQTSDSKRTLEYRLRAYLDDLQDGAIKGTTGNMKLETDDSLIEYKKSVPFHHFFKEVINSTGIATTFYRGRRDYEAEAGQFFEVCVTRMELSNMFAVPSES